MTRFALALSLGAAAALTAAPLGAQTVLDFEQFASPTTREFGIPASFTDPLDVGGGFFADVDGGDSDLNAWGFDATLDPDGESNRPGSTALFMEGGGNAVFFYHAREEFNARSIDVAPLYNSSFLAGALPGAITLRFYGFIAGVTPGEADFVQDFTFAPQRDGSGRPQLTTLRFDNRWVNLEVMAWEQLAYAGDTPLFGDQYYHQFDNLVLQTVPEPGTVALVATGLAGLLGAGWRRRRAG